MKILIFLLVFLAFLVSGEEYDCEEGELEIGCAGELMLPAGIASRAPFFRDALGASCTSIRKGMISEEEEIHTFFSEDEGMSVSAACPHNHHVIHKFKFCMEEEHVSVITLHCRMLNNPEWIIGPYEATSDEMHHSFVRCNEDSVIQSIDMTESGDGVVTRVVLGCIEIQMDDE